MRKQYELIKANDSKLFTLDFAVNFQAQNVRNVH